MQDTLIRQYMIRETSMRVVVTEVAGISMLLFFIPIF